MSESERIEFHFSFEYDPKKKDDFESIWGVGFKMLTIADNYAAESDTIVNITVNETPGALEERRLVSLEDRGLTS